MKGIRINIFEYRKLCSNGKKKDHFHVVCDDKRRIESKESTDSQKKKKKKAEIYAINIHTKTREK